MTGRADESGQQLPLRGIRVLELAHIVAGPHTGRILADLGADVVKVEPPNGDGLRDWPPRVAGKDDEYGLNFAVVNHGKRSIVLDLKTDAGRRELFGLATKADVLIENFRPGTLARIGISTDDVIAANPRLVWCSVSGFGQVGPLATAGAYDVVVQGYSGMMSVTGTPGGEPAKCGVPVADFVAGLYGAVAVLAALWQRHVTGTGAVLDCPMLACLLAVSSLQASEYWGTGRDPERMGSAHPRNAPYQAFECNDGYITVAAGNQALWVELCQVLERTDLVADRRYLNQDDRRSNQATLFGEIAPIFKSRSRAEWLRLLEAAGVPCGPVNSFSEALNEPQVAFLEMIRDLPLPTGGATFGLAFPVRREGWSRDLSPPPLLGEHTSAVRREWLGGEGIE